MKEMSGEDMKLALREGRAKEEEYYGLPYVRLTDEFHKIPRGTVLFSDGFVYGYPGIGRILAPDVGLPRHFHHPFHAEEKIDGYNVRIFRHQERILALTRGGFICPFTTDRIEDLMDTGIFRDHPDLVLCGEVAGPMNPYNEESPAFIKKDIELFVFDIMRKNVPVFLSHEEKSALIEQYGLPAVRCFGLFEPHDFGAIQKILRELNETGREGLVLKEDSPHQHRAKYVTGNSSVEDIRITSPFLMELPGEYYTSRLLRLAIYLQEEKSEPDAALYEELGRAFLAPLFESIRSYGTNRKVFHTYRCRFRDRENARRLLEQLKEHMPGGTLVEKGLERENDHWLLVFQRNFPIMNGLLSQFLAGGMVFD